MQKQTTLWPENMVTLSRAQLCILEDSGAQALAGDGHISGRGAEAKAVDLAILSA